MAQPVWVLSVDLQTKTATFQSGMADAAKSARSAFTSISSDSAQMAGDMSKHTTDVYHSLGLLDNTLRGDHRRAFVDLIRMYQDSAVVMGALPFAATAGGILLVAGAAVWAAQKIHDWNAAQEKLGDDFTRLQTAGDMALRSLDEKLLSAGERSDELRNDHLGALKKQLELIDMQSMDDLVHAFGTIQKAADTVFKDLAAHWYTLGSGSAGASHALEEFKVQYESLLAQGKDKEASDLLHGTLESAQKILALQKQAAAGVDLHQGQSAQESEYVKFAAAAAKLDEMKVGFSQNELKSQQALVTALQTQVNIEERINELKKTDSGNATRTAGNELASQHSAAARQAAESQLRVAQSTIQGQKAAADAQLEIHRATIAARLASDLDFAQREHAAQVAANQAEIAALDQSGRDYQNQLAALHEKALEEDAQYSAKVAQITARAAEEQAQKDQQDLEQAIREQVDATRQGSAARLAAIDAGIREEQARQMQNTSFYRDLLNQRVEVTREMAQDEAEQAQQAGAERAANEQKMGELELAAMKETFALYNSAHRASAALLMAEAIEESDRENAIKRAALQQQIAALDKSGKDYQNKLKALQDQEKQLVQQHENEITAIRDKAEIERNQRILTAETQMDNSIATGLTNVLMRHQTFTQMMMSLSNQVVSGLMRTAIQSVLADDFTKERDAAAAARKAFLAGMQLPFPANLVAAPALAAGAFASVMAFQSGTDSVPGVGKGDKVPALLEPGEGVVPGGVMDGLRHIANNGGFNQKPAHAVNMRNTYHVQTIDGDGMEAALHKHADVLQRHVEGAMRRANHN